VSASVVSVMLQQSFDWMNESCLNNLNDVYKQYCKDARPLEKHLRDVFVSGTVDDVIQNFQVRCRCIDYEYGDKYIFGMCMWNALPSYLRQDMNYNHLELSVKGRV